MSTLAEAQQLQQQLLAAQNADGGWSYSWGLGVSRPRQSSWTEPTALAVIASHTFHESSESRQKALRWLVKQQRPDGGWAPNANVDASTSVTSLALVALLSGEDYRENAAQAALWSLKQVYTGNFSPALLLARILGIPPAHAPGSVAWFPGTAGWVTPTALSIIALSQATAFLNLPHLAETVEQSQNYLLNRRCLDGGWNHGGSNTRSEDAISYPETTGISLLALSSLPKSKLEQPLLVGKKYLNAAESLEGLCWLQMGLAANGIQASDPVSVPPPRTSRDAALRLLALAFRSGRPSLLSPKGLVS